MRKDYLEKAKNEAKIKEEKIIIKERLVAFLDLMVRTLLRPKRKLIEETARRRKDKGKGKKMCGNRNRENERRQS